MKGNETGSGVMSPGREDTDVHGKIDMRQAVVGSKCVDSVAVEFILEVTVIAPGCIRVRKMTVTGTV